MQCPLSREKQQCRCNEVERGGVTNKRFTSAELFYNTADNGRLGSQHFRAACFFFFLFSRAKSLGRRLSNGRQIATRCVADIWTSVWRNPTLFMTVTVTAKPSQAAVLGESDCKRSTMNTACFDITAEQPYWLTRSHITNFITPSLSWGVDHPFQHMTSSTQQEVSLRLE